MSLDYRQVVAAPAGDAAAQFGLAYRSPRDLAELEQAYTAASQGGVTLIECRLPADNAATVLKALAAHCQSL